MPSVPISHGGMTYPHLFKTTKAWRLPVPPSSTNLLQSYSTTILEINQIKKSNLAGLDLTS